MTVDDGRKTSPHAPQAGRITLRRIAWQDTVALRHRVLWPDREPTYCLVDGDEHAWHLGAFLAGTLVAVASVYPWEDGARLRKFAILPEHQGSGIGSAMLRHMLAVLSANGASFLCCDARESAIGFYTRFGLQPEGERFFKGPIPYVRMRCRLR